MKIGWESFLYLNECCKILFPFKFDFLHEYTWARLKKFLLESEQNFFELCEFHAVFFPLLSVFSSFGLKLSICSYFYNNTSDLLLRASVKIKRVSIIDCQEQCLLKTQDAVFILILLPLSFKTMDVYLVSDAFKKALGASEHSAF